MLTVIVILVVSGALILGAAWGIYGNLPDAVEGFIVALAGGALIISLVLELIKPATEETSLWAAFALVVLGATIFVAMDYVVKKKWGGRGSGGLLVAVTLDGIPENLALGVALIGAGPLQVAALSGSIFLSNLPEAAGGAKEMSKQGKSKVKVSALWSAIAALLSAAALSGNLFLAGVPQSVQRGFVLDRNCCCNRACLSSFSRSVGIVLYSLPTRKKQPVVNQRNVGSTFIRVFS